MQPQDKPTDVTDAMIEAGANAFGACLCDTCCPSASDRDYFGTIYRAMEAARPPVQTDGLVEPSILRATARQLNDFWAQDSGTSLHVVAADQLVIAADRIEALQRSNAEKDEALLDIQNRIICPVGPSPTLDEIAEIASKALSHSSETSK
jgi:hypothetical protein